jgi:hypothetical protein
MGSGTISGAAASGASGGGSASHGTAGTAANPTTTAFVHDDAAIVSPVCFRPGTRIATPRGFAAVEDLVPGDLVLTIDGAAEPVRWIGRQTIATRLADPIRVQPIRIRAGAIGAGVPTRDLLVSPDHAIGIDGILAHASALVDGLGVVREPLMGESLAYLHIELAEHRLVLAEGLAAETFIDNPENLAFDNGAERAVALGDAPPAAEMSLPRAKSRRQLPQATRLRLEARARMLFAQADGEVARVA